MMERINRKNIDDWMQHLSKESTPESVWETYETLKAATNNFTDWSFIDGDPSLQEVEQVFYDTVGKVASMKKPQPATETEKPEKTQKNPHKTRVSQARRVEEFLRDHATGATYDDWDKFLTERGIQMAKGNQRKLWYRIEKRLGIKELESKSGPKKKKQPDGLEVVYVLPEVRFIKRFVLLDGKTVTADKILTFINSLQRAIRSHQIRKNSRYADEIIHIQRTLINIWRSHRGSKSPFTIEVDAKDKKVMDAYREIAVSERPMRSIMLIKRYLSIQGKENVKEKAKILLKRMSEYYSNTGHEGEIMGYPYDIMVARMMKSLKDYIDGVEKYPLLDEQGLNGLAGLGILDVNHKLKKGDLVKTYSGIKGRVAKVHEQSIELDSHPGRYYNKKKVRKINGLDGVGCCPQIPLGTAQTNIINATDLRELQFQTAGYGGKWLILIGDPVEPYALMIWSKPGKGKSSLMIEFAHYLADKLDKKVLFASIEEGVSYTLQDKFQRMNAFHGNIDISPNALPPDLSMYDYVIIDSVNKFGLHSSDIDKLKKTYPSVCFLLIFQSTKNGDYRGTEDLEHLVDVSININDEGYASAQKSRFGARGSVNVFPDEFERIYRYSNLQDAEKFRDKKRAEGIDLIIVGGDDGKIWLIEPEKAAELSSNGFEIL